MPDTITITVGTETQRTWTLPKELLAQRSYLFAQLFTEETTISDKHLANITPYTFADFVDYLRSGIYTANSKVADYNAVRANVDACILGAQLGADDYRKAALRTLHKLFKPLAQSTTSNATRSMLRAADMEYVCMRASTANLAFAPCVTDTAAMMRGLRMLCYDGLAAHWTQRNVVFFSGYMSAPKPRYLQLSEGSLAQRQRKTPTWGSLFTRFPEFRARLVVTKDAVGETRSWLLRDAEFYFLPAEGVDMDVEANTESSDDSETEDESVGSEQDSVIGDGGDARAKRQKLTLKLRGFGSSQDGGGGGEEVDRTRTEDDMKPEHIEDIDVDAGREQVQTVIKVETDSEDDVMPEQDID